jgi:hypothetical protein
LRTLLTGIICQKSVPVVLLWLERNSRAAYAATKSDLWSSS